MFYNYEERPRTTWMRRPLSSITIRYEKRINTYFRDDRNTQEIPWDFALEMGLLHMTLLFHTCKSQVPCKWYFYGLSRLKSWDFSSSLGLVHMAGTWDPVWTGPKPKEGLEAHMILYKYGLYGQLWGAWRNLVRFCHFRIAGIHFLSPCGSPIVTWQ